MIHVEEFHSMPRSGCDSEGSYGGMKRKHFPVGRGWGVGGAGPTDAEIIQDDGRTRVEKVYKLVPKSSRYER